MYILFVEDDIIISKLIGRGWPVPSDRIEFVSNFARCSRLIATRRIDDYDAAVLDMNLPDGNATQILTELRLQSDLPAIVISGSGGPELRSSTLDIGADDYIMKPFSVRELQARVARAVNRYRGAAKLEKAFDFGLFRFDPSTKTISSTHVRMSMTDMESRLLFQLVRNPGKACSRQHLAETVCLRTFRPEDKTIDIYIGRLRKMLAQFGCYDGIETVRGTGYRFVI